MKYAASLITGPRPSVCQSTTVQVPSWKTHVVQPVVAVDEAERAGAGLRPRRHADATKRSATSACSGAMRSL